MEKIIKISGKGEKSFSPDTTIIELKFSKLCISYEEALQLSVFDLEKIQNSLKAINLDKDCVKTTYFNISTQTERIRDEHGNYKKTLFLGYKYDQTLRITFPRSNEALGKIVNLISQNDMNSDIRISYILKDAEKAKEEVLKLAVEDAKRKATLIAESLGLKNIVPTNINYHAFDYSDDEYGYKGYKMCLEAPRSLEDSIDIEPEDIELSDTVVVSFMFD